MTTAAHFAQQLALAGALPDDSGFVAECIDLADIHPDSFQPRKQLDDAAVEAYAARYAADEDMPPIVVYCEGDLDAPTAFWLADGFHRVAALRQNGATTVVDALIAQGTQRDAKLAAIGVNQAHGVRLTSADKRRIVEHLLVDDEWRTWSDRAIAERAGVSHAFVSKLRRKMEAANLIPPTPERTTKAGTTQAADKAASESEDDEPIVVADDDLAVRIAEIVHQQPRHGCRIDSPRVAQLAQDLGATEDQIIAAVVKFGADHNLRGVLLDLADDTTVGMVMRREWANEPEDAFEELVFANRDAMPLSLRHLASLAFGEDPTDEQIARALQLASSATGITVDFCRHGPDPRADYLVCWSKDPELLRRREQRRKRTLAGTEDVPHYPNPHNATQKLAESKRGKPPACKPLVLDGKPYVHNSGNWIRLYAESEFRERYPHAIVGDYADLVNPGTGFMGVRCKVGGEIHVYGGRDDEYLAAPAGQDHAPTVAAADDSSPESDAAAAEQASPDPAAIRRAHYRHIADAIASAIDQGKPVAMWRGSMHDAVRLLLVTGLDAGTCRWDDLVGQDDPTIRAYLVDALAEILTSGALTDAGMPDLPIIADLFGIDYPSLKRAADDAHPLP